MLVADAVLWLLHPDKSLKFFLICVDARCDRAPTRLRLDKVASGSHFSMMRSVGLKILKNKLAEYVRLAASGETVLVTDRDRVVAELSPPRIGRAETLMDARLAEFVRGGLIAPPTRPRGVPPGRRPVAATEELLAELRTDRDAR